MTAALLRTSEGGFAASSRRPPLFGRRSRADDERRIHQFLDGESAVSETPISLAGKLGVDIQIARDVLEDLADAGALHRRVFPDIEWMYCRFPSLDER